ncbi:BOBBER 1-like [Chlorella sorokiniana]|uniref:BOBBER 1-like n=1 Tax=Chlorella sorokiniana TaxID=3076 RepID=A0A2P6TLX4_CHLSO|nr:BOBBER 1-like [Chlorella sorokiniana]|eukprot:PRW45246.1 BOBBER 1-like [Chlorella sorokiniana]
MIEEIDSTAYNKHYLEKVYNEVGSDPQAFLAAALDYVKQESSFFAQPGAAEAVARLVQARLPAGGAAPAAPAAAAAAGQHAAPAAAVAATAPEAGGQQPAAAASAAAGEAQPAEQAATAPPAEAAEAAEPSTLTPNDGNGADLGRYSWTQSLSEVVVSVPVPPGTKGRGCDVALGRDKLRVGLRGHPPVLDGPLFAAVKPDDCLWNLVDGRQLEVTLQKVDAMQWWRAVVKGEPEIDVQKVEPEASKLTDLDPEMRATVEKMMWDQRQKALGLPTSEEQRKADIMKQFMTQHPEMDFSNAKIDLS